MTPYKPGAVVLVRFPFTELRQAKKRPAVVVSPPEYWLRHGDVAVLALTGQTQPEAFLSLQDWHAAGLLGPTWIKPAVFTVSETILDRQIGTLTSDDARRVPKALALLIADPFLS